MSAAPSHTNTHHYGASPPTAFLNDTSDLSHYRRRSSVKVPLPVLDHDETALSEPLLGVLDALFAKYDVDHDQSLCPEELDAFVFATNGQHPGDEWLEAFSQRFGANESGWLTKDGFLAFYLEQTLGDQDETRKDIQAHGYDAYTLQPAHLP
ncbi:hypothetical protein DM01DRAFT_257628 [Hesseltinella vesiculosa]|uniref:EF-hand domain-containing protein n=1 Tax=Hesseltinella vesiculosa TaxID=101127 RepID=A0A1X2GJD3_9FUNG|nr:hypothetical protein DM01DRAFT_257628 [Hesseltinella vesiculosa]